MLIQGVADEDVSSPAGTEATDAAFDLLANLIDMGERIYASAFGEQGIESVNAKEVATCVTEMSPSKTRLLALAASPAFYTLDEYLELFDGAVSVDVEGETVWPCQPAIDYDTLME